MINSTDKFKMCREFIIMINSDVFKVPLTQKFFFSLLKVLI